MIQNFWLNYQRLIGLKKTLAPNPAPQNGEASKIYIRILFLPDWLGERQNP